MLLYATVYECRIKILSMRESSLVVENFCAQIFLLWFQSYEMRSSSPDWTAPSAFKVVNQMWLCFDESFCSSNFLDAYTQCVLCMLEKLSVIAANWLQPALELHLGGIRTEAFFKEQLQNHSRLHLVNFHANFSIAVWKIIEYCME